MDKILERLREFGEEARYAYADSVTNAFITAQIKELREERGLTQEKLAELVGTKQSGISRWQNSGYSSCKVETLRKFARSFGVRLRITFEEFGSLPEDVRGFTNRRLSPRKFDKDPAFSPAVASATGTRKHGQVPDGTFADWTKHGTTQLGNTELTLPDRDSTALPRKPAAFAEAEGPTEDKLGVTSTLNNPPRSGTDLRRLGDLQAG